VLGTACGAQSRTSPDAARRSTEGTRHSCGTWRSGIGTCSRCRDFGMTAKSEADLARGRAEAVRPDV